MFMVMDPRKNCCRGMVASIAKVATASVAVTTSAAACLGGPRLGAMLEPLALLGLLCRLPGCSSLRSCRCFHHHPHIHIHVHGSSDLLVGLLRLCWPLGDDRSEAVHRREEVALVASKEPPQLVHGRVDLHPDLGYVPIGDNTIILPLGLAPAGSRKKPTPRRPLWAGCRPDFGLAWPGRWHWWERPQSASWRGPRIPLGTRHISLLRRRCGWPGAQLVEKLRITN